MGGVEGVRFIPLNATSGGTSNTLTNLLMSGAILRGRIAAEGALLNLVVAGQRMPLPKSVALPAGTSVEVQLLHGPGTPQLRLRMLDSAAQATPTLPQAPSSTPQNPSVPARIQTLPPALADLLKPEQAAALLPKIAALPPKTLEALLTVFVARSDVGQTLARLVALVSAEVSEGRLPAKVVMPAEAAMETMAAESPEEFRRAIELAREMIGARGDRTVTVPTARETQTPRTILEDIARLREALSARGEVRGAGEAIKALNGFVERLSNSTLQNIRALDTPYQFFAIPLAPRTGIEHAQVHVVGRDGRGSGGGGGREAHVVALDLHLTHLGPLWITIQSAGPACNCVFRAGDESVRNAIDEGSPALEAGLRRAGFAAAQVRTEAWDGDRVEAAAALFARTASFEAEA